MRRLLTLVAGALLFAPAALHAQDSLTAYTAYYIDLRKAEDASGMRRIDLLADGLHAITPPPAVDSLHRELLNRVDRWAAAASKADMASPNGIAACEQGSLSASGCSPSSPSSAESRARTERQVALSQYQKVRGKIYERLQALGLPIRKDGRPLRQSPS